MNITLQEIREAIDKRAELAARLRLLVCDGTPEIKGKDGRRYIYSRRRVGGKLTSKYIGPWTDELFALAQRSASEARTIRREIRAIDRRLAELGYSEPDLAPEVLLNIEFARANMKTAIFDQSVLEGVGATFPQTEAIVEGGVVNGVTADGVRKIVNLKHAWEFILDRDVVAYGADFSVLCQVAKIVNEGFYTDGDRLRRVPVAIGGTSYIPPIPSEPDVKEMLAAIISSDRPAIETAAELCVSLMKAQLFLDGNKRAAVIFASLYLIARGEGVLVIPATEAETFRSLLVEFYDGAPIERIVGFIREHCWRHL